MAETTTARKTAAKTTAPVPDALTIWERLAAPFPQDDLEKLPRNLKARDENKGRCENDRYSADGFYCHGYHARSIHLDYVGHAGITQRLNDVLGPGGWDFGPLASTPEGLPLMRGGEFWATLTVRVLDQEPVTKTDVAANFSSVQEAWGDALRRCAMRFGVGTYLWSKSEAALALKRATDENPYAEAERPGEKDAGDRPQGAQGARQEPQQAQAGPTTQPPHVAVLQQRLSTLGPADTAEVRAWWSAQGLPFLADLDTFQASAVMSYLDEKAQQAPTDPQ